MATLPHSLRQQVFDRARLPVHRLPDGVPIHPVDLGAFGRNDRLVSLLLLGKPDEEEDAQEQILVLATRQGRVKRVTLAEARSAVGVVTAMNVDDGDELVGAALSHTRLQAGRGHQGAGQAGCQRSKSCCGQANS